MKNYDIGALNPDMMWEIKRRNTQKHGNLSSAYITSNLVGHHLLLLRDAGPYLI
jgi:hypothetical protein